MVSTLDRTDLAALKKKMTEVAATAREVAAAAPQLADDVASARAKVDQLASGLTTLADGSARLRDGLGGAANGADQLRGGLYRLATGARQLDGGLAQLSSGSDRLADGLTKLEGGAGDLADGLAAGEEKLPGYDDAEQPRRHPRRPGRPDPQLAAPGRLVRRGLRAVLPRPGALGRRDDHVHAAAAGQPAARDVRRARLAGRARRLAARRGHRAAPRPRCSSPWSPWCSASTRSTGRPPSACWR